jgi:hypothetical protein
MNDADFKKKNRPALCTEDPVFSVIPKDKVHELLNICRQKARDHGESDYDLGCPKRFTCDGNCTGRPIVSYIDELKPYIKKIEHLMAPDGMIYVKGCKTCPISKTCKRVCNQVSDYMERTKNKEDIHTKDQLFYKNKSGANQKAIDEYVHVPENSGLGEWVTGSDDDSQTGILAKLIERYGSIQDTIEHMPWGAINEKRARLVRMYCFEGKDFRACSKELGYSSGLVARNEFYRALTALSKFATVRFYIEEHRDEIADVDYELLQLRYYQFLTVNEIAKQLNLCVGTVRSRLFRFISKSKLQYTKYVSKNKVIPSSIF